MKTPPINEARTMAAIDIFLFMLIVCIGEEWVVQMWGGINNMPAILLSKKTCRFAERHRVADDSSEAVRSGRQSCRLRKQNRRSEEHTSELQSRGHIVCRLL